MAVGDPGTGVFVGVGVGDEPVLMKVRGAVVLVDGVSLELAARDPVPRVEPGTTVDA